MFKLDNAFLEELGLGSLPAVEKNKMLAHIYETLETRVGIRLAEQMTNEQLDEFEGYINRQDEAGALKWLESNFPNYKQVVAEELEKLKSEIRQVAPQIVAQAAQNAQAVAQPAPSPGMGMPQQAPDAYAQQPQPSMYPQQPMQNMPMDQYAQPQAVPQQPTQNAYQQPMQPPAPQPIDPQYQQPQYAQPAMPPQQPYAPMAPPPMADQGQASQTGPQPIDPNQTV